MARINQAEKARNAQVQRERENRIPVDNIIKVEVNSLEDLLSIYPVFEMNKSFKEHIASHWEKFDFEIVDKAIHTNSWSNYDESGFLFVFIGIDGNIYYCDKTYSPMIDDRMDNGEPYLIEVTAKEAKQEIDNFIAVNDDMENSGRDWCF